MVAGTSLQSGNANNRLLRFIALGAIMPVVLIRYVLGFADRMT
jgi:energy-converting hydrogenase Eha subunit E